MALVLKTVKLVNRNALRDATRHQHARAEQSWAGAGAWDLPQYMGFLGQLARAHLEFGLPAARTLWRDDLIANEEARLAALGRDLGGLPEVATQRKTTLSQAWGIGYVLNGSALGASIMIKSDMLGADWPQAYMRLGRRFATEGGVRRFFDDLDAARLDLPEAIDGANRCFALFTQSTPAVFV